VTTDAVHRLAPQRASEIVRGGIDQADRHTHASTLDLGRSRGTGAARFAFNWELAQVRANLAQRAAERSYGVADEDLTLALGWSLPALRRAWNQAKHEVAPLAPPLASGPKLRWG
jgi:hypothetical protein